MLGEQFEQRPNALNAIRLLLAALVVLWHAHPVHTDHLVAVDTMAPLSWPVVQLLAQIHVDAFFAISGFLIVRSWHRHPHVGHYLAARALRLMPGLWGCLLVTAFVIAPLATLVAGLPQPTLDGRVEYVAGNLGLWVSQYGIDGGLTTGFAQDALWNGSLWTLWWEACCYLGIAALGIVGLLSARTARVAVALCWALGLVSVIKGWPIIDAFNYGFIAGPRLVLMFSVGALLWFGRDTIPINRTLAAASVVLIVVGSFTPNYRLVAAPAIAYICLWAALQLGRFPRLVLRNDLSYGLYLYSFPLQTALLMVGVSLGWAGLTLLSLAVTLPVAALSWFLLERPAMRLQRRTAQRVRRCPPDPSEPSGSAARPPYPGLQVSHRRMVTILPKLGRTAHLD